MVVIISIFIFLAVTAGEASTAGAMIGQRRLMLVTIAAVGNDVIITSKCGVRLNSVLRIRRAHCLDHNKWGEGN